MPVAFWLRQALCWVTSPSSLGLWSGKIWCFRLPVVLLGKSAEFVALIWLYSPENPSTYPSAWLKMAPKIRLLNFRYLFTHHVFMDSVLTSHTIDILLWLFATRMGCKQHPLVVVVVVDHNADVHLHNVWDGYHCTICSAVCATHCLTNPSAGHLQTRTVAFVCIRGNTLSSCHGEYSAARGRRVRRHTSTINTQATLRLLHIFHVVTCNSNCRGSKWGLHGFCQT